MAGTEVKFRAASEAICAAFALGAARLRSGPATGRPVERGYTPKEHAALADASPALGETAFDIWLNANACWRNVPAAVWNYRLGGYRVLKKWLSYRESKVLGRPLRIEEVQHFTETARRIAAISTLERLALPEPPPASG
ncbi:hypothetical protein F4X86_03945 [Candidatus Saccharibacteria bacterium]|nr:hypothetical protein [Candidatus Saccharibacteria bacterium]